MLDLNRRDTTLQLQGMDVKSSQSVINSTMEQLVICVYF